MVKKVFAKSKSAINRTDTLNRYLREMLKFPLLSNSETVSLIRDGEYDKAFTGNLRLAYTVAHSYQWMGDEFLDVIQNANIGLHDAVMAFNPASGYKFASFAVWYIKGAICKAMNQQRELPKDVVTLERLTAEAVNRIFLETGAFCYEADVIYDYLADHYRLPKGTSVESVRRVLDLKNCQSMDMVVGDDGDAVLSDMIVGDSLTDDFSVKNDAKVMANNALELLSDRDRRIVCLRFGMEDGHMWGFEELASEFCLTEERIRQVIRNLPHLRKQLPDYFSGYAS